MMAVTVFRPEHVELNLSMLLSRFRKNVEHLSGVVKMTPSSMSRAAEDNNGMLEDRGVRWGGGAGEGAARPALSPPSTGGGTILEHGPSDRDSWCWRACFARVDADAALGMGAPSSRRQMWPRHALLRRDAHARLDAADAGATRVFFTNCLVFTARGGEGSYRGIPRYTAKYRSNSNFKPKPLKTASSNGIQGYTAV
jgi:hypothetical protein